MQRAPGDRRPVVLATLFLADEAARERVLALPRRFPRLRLVVVTDAAAIAPFLAQGFVVEHFPNPAAVRGLEARGDWRTYLERRRALVLTKWGPAFEREEGASFGDYLEACTLENSRRRDTEERQDARETRTD